jgi:hypothetical protein
MSARVESTPVREPSTRPIVIAIVAAVGLAALAVGTVRFASDDDRPAVATSVHTPLWDAQKLEAMEGRVLAEQVATSAIVVPALEPGELKAILEGRGTVEQVGAPTTGWDAAKLEAMEGRVLAEQASAEDPIVTPHIPKRQPQH